MRPRGELRQALDRAARELSDSGCMRFSFRDLAAKACVGFDAARSTARDMERAGDLSVSGVIRDAGSFRPLKAYELPGGPRRLGVAALDEQMPTWAEFV